jgi:transmembrane 9 superfamily protein 2/4
MPLDEKHSWDGIAPEGMNKELKTCPSTNNHLQHSDIAAAQIVKPGETILYTYCII